MSESTAVAIPTQEKWKREVESYEKQRYNVLAPREIGELPAFHMPHMSIIQVNPDKDAGETYPLPGGKLGLSKVVLDRIAQAGSITWIPDACKSGWRSPRKYHYLAVGVVKGLDAVRRTIIGEKEIDLDVIEEELRASVPRRERCPGKEPERSRWIETTVRDEMISFKKHIAARTESGAKNRAIRSAYGLKSSYTPEEIKHPFVIPRVVPFFDMRDPEVKKMVLGDALGIIPELYGKGPELPLPTALPPVQDEEEEPEPVGTSEPIKDAEIESPVPEGQPETQSQPPPDPDAVRFEEAQGDAKKEQEALTRLIARKGYKTDKLLKPLDQFSKEQRAGFLKHLLTMKDVQPPELPWK